MGSTFSKKIGFRKVEIQTNVETCPEMVRNGSRKMIGGSREVRVGQNLAANPLEGLPEARNVFKNPQKANNFENHENQCFFVFFLFPGVGPIVPIFTVWGHPLQSFPSVETIILHSIAIRIPLKIIAPK